MTITQLAVHTCALTAVVSAVAGAAQAQDPVNRPAAASSTQHARRAPADMKAAGWTMTFRDEFDGTALDRSKWMDSYPKGDRTHGGVNGEHEYYAPEACLVKDGKLEIVAERREQHGVPFTSGMVTSFGSFSQKYGWWEIRTRIPKGKGMWPAFWLLPADDSWPPEIDILEILGHEPNTVYLTNHYKNAEGKHEGKGDRWIGPDFSADFHTYAVDWEPDEIVWYVDGVERYQTKANVPKVPMYVLANLAVGGDWPGQPDATTPFPSSMSIDYIRVYQKAVGKTQAIGSSPSEKRFVAGR